MLSATAQIAFLLAAVAAACAGPGVFLLLRRTTLVADAISHVVLLGIVLAYFVVRDLASPWLLAGAAGSGLLTVLLVEALQRTRRVAADAAIGVVFPALFSLGTLLVSLYLRDTHLDIDRVLLGSAELALNDTVRFAGIGLPRSAVMVGGLGLLNVALGALFYKQLQLSTFDPALARTLGLRPGLWHYALMAAVSVTVVAAFDAVGPVLVVAFLAIPAATGTLLTDRLGTLLWVSAVAGIGASSAGAAAAVRYDLNIAGTATAALAGLFALTWLVAPNQGLIAGVVRRWRQRREFHVTMLLIHLAQHEGTPEEEAESRIDGLHRHFRWEPDAVAAVVGRAERRGLVESGEGRGRLTVAGRERAAESLGR